jgi:hypothetical protein
VAVSPPRSFPLVHPSSRPRSSHEERRTQGLRGGAPLFPTRGATPPFLHQFPARTALPLEFVLFFVYPPSRNSVMCSHRKLLCLPRSSAPPLSSASGVGCPNTGLNYGQVENAPHFPSPGAARGPPIALRVRERERERVLYEACRLEPREAVRGRRVRRRPLPGLAFHVWARLFKSLLASGQRRRERDGPILSPPRARTSLALRAPDTSDGG